MPTNYAIRRRQGSFQYADEATGDHLLIQHSAGLLEVSAEAFHARPGTSTLPALLADRLDLADVLPHALTLFSPHPRPYIRHLRFDRFFSTDDLGAVVHASKACRFGSLDLLEIYCAAEFDDCKAQPVTR